jgi:sigma-B regulation protein RsbU (phosphoserine phosphatase)
MVIAPNFNRLYEHAACGLISFERDGTILHVNQTLLRWLGFTIDELQNTKFQDLLIKGGKLYFSLFVLPSLQMQPEIKEVSIEIQTASQGSFSALFSAVAFDQSVPAQRIIDATIFKIADRKKYEAELLKEKEQVKEENLVKTQVLAEVAFNQAHLIRAPLANIMGLIGLLDEDKETTDDTRHTLILLKDSALNLDRVVKDIVGLIK